MSTRTVAIMFTGLSGLLLVLPFFVHGLMPRDAVAPERVSGAGAFILGLIWVAGLAAGAVALLAAGVAMRRRDRVTAAVAIPVLCLAVVAAGMLWVEGI